MKKTLYQILGVDPKASTQDIEAAYSRRLEELKVSTIQDPNKLVILQQSKEILSDPAQRSVYDVSISEREVRAPPPADVEPERTFVQQWGKWIAAAVVLIGLFVLWPKHEATPPPQNHVAKQIAPATIAPAPPPVPPAGELAAASKGAALPATPAQTPAGSDANPVLGEWSCTDAISGHTSKYNFKDDSVLSIVSSDGQTADRKYEFSGKVLTLTDPRQVSTLAIEELVARKMILNTGVDGRRLVCKR